MTTKRVKDVIPAAERRRHDRRLNRGIREAERGRGPAVASWRDSAGRRWGWSVTR